MTQASSFPANPSSWSSTTAGEMAAGEQHRQQQTAEQVLNARCAGDVAVIRGVAFIRQIKYTITTQKCSFESD